MSSTDNFLLNILKSNRRNSEFYDQYQALSGTFNAKVHPKVTELAIASDGIFLTDHGPAHIAQVIKKAGKLLSGSREKITLYEAYLLLVAIHLHDIGNALGRAGHEQKAGEIFELVYGPIGFDELDRTLAEHIASVHGGRIDGSKDTIRSLDPETTWNNNEVRPQFLAAVLKLADEMAEDRHRANQLGVHLDKIKKSSEAHHVYAYGLHSITCEPAACTMKMGFAYDKQYFQRPLGFDQTTVQLLDEIYSRSLKMYSEALYCSRYFRGAIRFDRVHVDIEIFGENKRRIRRITYLLEQSGYEDHPRASIYDRAPTLKNFEGHGNLTSALLNKLLEG